MSPPPFDARRARRLLKSLRSGPVPDPGDDYWASFMARVRARQTESEAATPAVSRPPRAAAGWGGWALGLAASLALAGVLWQAAGPERDVEPDDPITAERLQALPAEVFDRALDGVIGPEGDETGGADELGDEDRRRLLESLRLEVAETSSPQAARTFLPEARLS